VNWNSLPYLRECLESIFTGIQVTILRSLCGQLHPGRRTIAIRAEYPSVVAIRSEKNLGFAGANNLGSGMPPRLSFLF